MLRATLQRELGLADQARSSYREALAHGADPSLVQFALGALGDARAAAAPRHYVEQLFDSYAVGFDEHLVGTLQYRGPQVLADGLGRERYASALDLGCGTGLAAPSLRPRCTRLEGVDLSAVMVERARARQLYDELRQADVVEALTAAPGAHDLLFAADVFIYVGALDAVFAAAARALRPGGELCFSVEPRRRRHRLGAAHEPALCPLRALHPDARPATRFRRAPRCPASFADRPGTARHGTVRLAGSTRPHGVAGLRSSCGRRDPARLRGGAPTSGRTRRTRLDFGYPRPQLQRANWTCLNGPWRFRYDDDLAFTRPQDIDHWPQQITIPFPPESRASGIDDQGFHKVCWYQRDIDVKPGKDRVILRFGAVDYARQGVGQRPSGGDPRRRAHPVRGRHHGRAGRLGPAGRHGARRGRSA